MKNRWNRKEIWFGKTARNHMFATRIGKQTTGQGAKTPI
ncbi:hypothetical protein BROSI_A2522 [Candidatus Brocadia sinica JPN1]|uniref:Uncharacterized protein n=1 Tax=Candidatus Brocadia sinica JPN1 TaxID=1197129 RepID=A0ABQ0JZ28_9BACT|nr:hypothetical protein BROSI_A2522 [Candidatus Brocadia sinica JPN1]